MTKITLELVIDVKEHDNFTIVDNEFVIDATETFVRALGVRKGVIQPGVKLEFKEVK